MPTSHPSQISKIIESIIMLKPNSILDIGVGFGKYGFLCREFLDVMEHEDYGKKTHIIEGIEVFPEYLIPVHEYIYDKVHIGNALNVLPKLKNYDLILMIDVLEHFKYGDGIKMLNLCKQHSKYIIISVPKNIGHQGTVHNNEFETHHYQWTDQWKDIWKNCIKINNYKSYIYICSDEPLNDKINKYAFNKFMDKFSIFLYNLHLLDFASKMKRKLIK